MIQIYSNSLGKEELNAIEKVFDSKWLGKGPKTEEFIELFIDVWKNGISGINISEIIIALLIFFLFLFLLSRRIRRTNQ